MFIIFMFVLCPGIVLLGTTIGGCWYYCFHCQRKTSVVCTNSKQPLPCVIQQSNPLLLTPSSLNSPSCLPSQQPRRGFSYITVPDQRIPLPLNPWNGFLHLSLLQAHLLFPLNWWNLGFQHPRSEPLHFSSFGLIKLSFDWYVRSFFFFNRLKYNRSFEPEFAKIVFPFFALQKITNLIWIKNQEILRVKFQ